MGGLALKNVDTVRCTRREFDIISNEIIDRLKISFKNVGIPKFYHNKKTFGDIDIVISTDGFTRDFRTYITEVFSPNEIFHNGNCWSFDYNEVQIDFITTSDEHFHSTLMYMSWNDMGNLIGRIAHGFGLKYGQEGLFFSHYFKGNNIGCIYVSKDYEKIFNFLDLSYERFLLGFDELVDIFEFISKSKYFNWKMFQLIELNKINRDRNKKRTSYVSFLDWVDKNVADSEHEYKFNKDKSEYIPLICDTFPEAGILTEIKRLEYEECKKLYIKSKFNGGDVMMRYGFKGVELGNHIKEFKIFIGNTKNYEDFILKTPTFEIYKEFDNYLKLNNEN